MVNYNEKGKITAQSPTNQSKVNFSGSKELFNTVSSDELLAVLSKIDFGMVSAEYVLNNVKVSQRFIDAARMPDDKKSTVRNTFGIILKALVEADEYLPKRKEEYDFDFQRYSPSEIESMLEDPESNYTKDEAEEDINNEISALRQEVATLIEKDEELYEDEIAELEDTITMFEEIAYDYHLNVD